MTSQKILLLKDKTTSLSWEFKYSRLFIQYWTKFNSWRVSI